MRVSRSAFWPLALLAVLQAATGAQAEDRKCLDTKGGRYCVGDTVFGPGDDGHLVAGELKSLDGDTSAMWNGMKLPLTELATIERGDCQSQAPQGGYYDRWDRRPHREISAVCVGDRVSNQLSKGIVLGKFSDGQLLVTDGKLPAHRELAYRFKREADQTVTKPELVEAVRGFKDINNILGTALAPVPDACPAADEPGPRAPRPEVQEKCEDDNKPFDLARSPSRKYFEQLLIKGTSAPIDDFLKLWFPDADPGERDSPFFQCEQMEGGPFQSIGEGNEYKDPCRPDTLFSWGPRVKLDAVTSKMSDGGTWTGDVNSGGQVKSGAVFTSISPVTTFGYGSTLLRFKLKPGTPARSRMWGAQGGELGIRTDNYHDFVIADASVVESVSFGTPEIYDEMVRDILRFKSGQRVSVYQNSYNYYPDDGRGAKDPLKKLWSQAADGYLQDEIGLKENLLEVIREILAGEGGVHYAKGVCVNRARAYATRNPNYVTPYPQKQ